MSDLFREFFVELLDGFSPYQEDMLWYTAAKEFLGPGDLLDGKFSKYLPKIQSGKLRYIIELYEDAIIGERYIKCLAKGNKPASSICPYTGWEVASLEVSRTTIDALDLVWESAIEFDESAPFKGDIQTYAINHHVLIAKLLSISLHLGWSISGGYNPFARKFTQLKSWKNRGIVGVEAIDSFLCGGSPYQSDAFLDIGLYLPTDQKKLLYKEAVEFYEQNMNREYFGKFNRKSPHHYKKDPIYRLTSQVYQEYDGNDPEWIAPFAEYYGGEAQERWRDS